MQINWMKNTFEPQLLLFSFAVCQKTWMINCNDGSFHTVINFYTAIIVPRWKYIMHKDLLYLCVPTLFFIACLPLLCPHWSWMSFNELKRHTQTCKRVPTCLVFLTMKAMKLRSIWQITVRNSWWISRDARKPAAINKAALLQMGFEKWRT